MILTQVPDTPLQAPPKGGPWGATKAGPPALDTLSNVQRLVHLAVRADSVYTDDLRAELTRTRARAYNDELSIQARRAGCSRQGEMESGEALSDLNELSKEDAEAFAKAYNNDLAGAIVRIGTDTPSANRNTYAARLREWEGERAEKKAGPLAMWAESSARSLAFEQFHKMNKLEGTAELEPADAVCPVCQGWAARGEVPLKVAANNPPPYHPNCPHSWQVTPEKIDDCSDVWMG